MNRSSLASVTWCGLFAHWHVGKADRLQRYLGECRKGLEAVQGSVDIGEKKGLQTSGHGEDMRLDFMPDALATA